MKRVLVTGAYGFLGKYLIRELTDNGYAVIAFGRKEEELVKISGDNIATVKGDFCKMDDIVAACEGVDYVIHCGALSTVWGRREDFIRTNVDGTANVIEACRMNNVQRLVYVSSPNQSASSAKQME